MKTQRIPALLLVLFTILAFSSCDMLADFIASRTRNIAVIQIYNSNKEKTNKLQPNDTMFVEVKGLKPDAMYQVECLDPEGELITMLTAQADEDGVISPSPLWYDVGFKKDSVTGKPVLPSETELGLSAFNIHVVSLDPEADTTSMTDFKLPFFIVYNTDLTRPQPIVMVGKQESGEFVLENSFEADGTQSLWVKVANLDDLPLQMPTTTTARVYVVAYKGAGYEDGEALANVIFYKDCTVAELGDGIQLDASQLTNGQDLTADSNSWATIPAWAQGRAFSVIVDVDNNSVYNIKKEGTDDFYLDGIDGNMVPGFVVKYPPVSTIDYVPANIASGGVYHWDYSTWDYDYDYRDEFKIDGLDTRYAWDWQFGGYGVKATWNPYINWGYGSQGVNQASIYYGSYVDVYIIDTQVGAVNPYPAGESIVASENWGRTKITLPVQYSCYNGCGQQTIWRSDGDATETNGGLKLGNYDVIVDIDRDGEYSDGDLVDNQPRTPNTTTWAPRTDGGFSVVTSY